MATPGAVLMIQCNAANYIYSQVVGLVMLFPWVVTGAFYIGYAVTGDGAFSVLSWSLTFMLLPMYPVQLHAADVWTDPFCGDFQTYMFPNMTCAVVACVITYSLFFRWWYGVRISWFQWFIALVMLLGPPIALSVMGGVAWWKTVLSLLWGVVWALIVCPVLWINQRGFAYLFTIPGFHGYYKESVLLRDDASVNLYRSLHKSRLDAAARRERQAQSYQAFSFLSSRHG